MYVFIIYTNIFTEWSTHVPIQAFITVPKVNNTLDVVSWAAGHGVIVRYPRMILFKNNII